MSQLEAVDSEEQPNLYLFKLVKTNITSLKLGKMINNNRIFHPIIKLNRKRKMMRALNKKR